MTTPQNADWNVDEDVQETPVEETAAPATRHADPTMPSLVMPNPVQVQKAALPKANNQPYVLGADELAALPNDVHGVFREMKARNPIYRGVVPTPKSLAEFAELKRRYAKLSQAPRFQPTDEELQKARLEAGRAITNSERDRVALILQLKTALEHDGFKPVIPDGDLPDVLLEFICEPAVIEKIVELRRALAAYHVLVLESFIYHSPSIRKQEQKIALQSNPSDDAVNQITQEITLMGSEHFRMLASNKAGQLHGVWNETVKPLLVDLLQGAELYVSEQKLALFQNAQNFLRESGGDETLAGPLSKKYDAVLSELKHRLNYAVNPGGGIARPAIGIHAPPVECALQQVFRIAVLPTPVDVEPQAAQ